MCLTKTTGRILREALSSHLFHPEPRQGPAEPRFQPAGSRCGSAVPNAGKAKFLCPIPFLLSGTTCCCCCLKNSNRWHESENISNSILLKIPSKQLPQNAQKIKQKNVLHLLGHYLVVAQLVEWSLPVTGDLWFEPSQQLYRKDVNNERGRECLYISYQNFFPAQAGKVTTRQPRSCLQDFSATL